MNKELWLIWKNPKNNSRRRYKVGKLSATSDGYIFEYSDDVDEAAKNGFQLYPGLITDTKNTSPKHYLRISKAESQTRSE